jgi:Tol biopolymer transport system component
LRYVVFDSDADLIGSGSTGRQIFLFDLQQRDRTGLPSLRQITAGAGDHRHGSTGTRAKTVAFDATPGGVGPRQIMFVTNDGTSVALTQGSADSVNPILDDSGRWLVFDSRADLLGAGFAGSQIYIADLHVTSAGCPYPCPATNNAGLRQLTHKTGTSAHPVVNKGGKVVAFESDADLLGTGETQTQIYRVDMLSSTTTRPTHGPGASRHPAISKDGNLLAFESDADLLGNGSTGTQVFLYKQSSGTTRQLSTAAGGGSSSPTIETTTGRGVFFASTADLLGNGSTGTQMFQYNVAADVLHQVTKTSSTKSDPAYSAGVFTVFVSDGDLLNNGSTGSELYLVNLFALQAGVVE